jgi:hypothetical protein
MTLVITRFILSERWGRLHLTGRFYLQLGQALLTKPKVAVPVVYVNPCDQ